MPGPRTLSSPFARRNRARRRHSRKRQPNLLDQGNRQGHTVDTSFVWHRNNVGRTPEHLAQSVVGVAATGARAVGPLLLSAAVVVTRRQMSMPCANRRGRYPRGSTCCPSARAPHSLCAIPGIRIRTVWGRHGRPLRMPEFGSASEVGRND